MGAPARGGGSVAGQLVLPVTRLEASRPVVDPVRAGGDGRDRGLPGAEVAPRGAMAPRALPRVRGLPPAGPPGVRARPSLNPGAAASRSVVPQTRAGTARPHHAGLRRVRGDGRAGPPPGSGRRRCPPRTRSHPSSRSQSHARTVRSSSRASPVRAIRSSSSRSLRAACGRHAVPPRFNNRLISRIENPTSWKRPITARRWSTEGSYLRRPLSREAGRTNPSSS